MSCHWLDPRYFQELARMDPAEVCARTGTKYCHDSAVYLLQMLGRIAVVTPGRATALWRGPDGAEAPMTTELALSALFYLLKCPAGLQPASEWVSEKELKGGLYLFQGTHELPLSLLAEAFGRDSRALLKAGQTLGGSRVEVGDVAVQVPALPKLPIRIVVWLEDDEFPASAKMLFPANADKTLPLDILYGLACDVCRLITTNRLQKDDTNSPHPG
ncbi:MAG: DUF3786 domain-containing protein [Deltaproteobacteria bacterium]|nr:DUF3786 domain-containing protein [Deltaproteobacteria bacterium]